jgi:hypothetical protein
VEGSRKTLFKVCHAKCHVIMSFSGYDWWTRLQCALDVLNFQICQLVKITCSTMMSLIPLGELGREPVQETLLDQLFGDDDMETGEEIEPGGEMMSVDPTPQSNQVAYNLWREIF